MACKCRVEIEESIAYPFLRTDFIPRVSLSSVKNEQPACSSNHTHTHNQPINQIMKRVYVN